MSDHVNTGEMHLTITPAQYKKLQAMGRKGGGSIPQAFDPDDWDEIKSVVDFPVYVAKGKGQYAGEGGFMTTLLSALTAVANNPVVKRLGKKAAKQAVDKVADFAKSKVSNSLGREAIDAAEAAAKKMIGDGRRMHGMGHSGGVRLSGRGHCSGSGKVVRAKSKLLVQRKTTIDV